MRVNGLDIEVKNIKQINDLGDIHVSPIALAPLSADAASSMSWMSRS